MRLTYKRVTWAFTGVILWMVYFYAGSLAGQVFKLGFYNKIQQRAGDVSPELWLKSRVTEVKYLLEPLDIEIVFPYQVWIRPGDKLFLAGTETEIGIVCAVREEKLTKHWIVYARIYPQHTSLLGNDSTFLLVRRPTGVGWIIKKLLQPRIDELKQELRTYLDNNADELREQVIPILKEIVRDSYKILEKNFPDFFELNKEEFSGHLKRIKTEHINEHLPVLQKIIWPILVVECQKEFKPIFDEMWAKFPKWDIAWAWVKDQVDDEETNVQKTLQNYFAKDVMPILQKHRPQLEKIPVTVMEKTWKDPRMKQSLKELMTKIMEDEQLMKMLQEMVIELYKQNEDELLKHLKKKWQSPEIQYKLRSISGNFEPYLIRMVNQIIRETGNKKISADFANVLRRKVFYKDRYCIYVTAGSRKNSFVPMRFSGQE